MSKWLNDESHVPGDDYPLLFDEICLYSWSESYPEPPLFDIVHSKKLCFDENELKLKMEMEEGGSVEASAL